MQRAVKGEVIASTFDRPADDHTTVAELAIERAKRLVEMGHDVVVLLDSITRRVAPTTSRPPRAAASLSGGVDSAALYRRRSSSVLPATSRNGGSLTILATALVETGSRMDEVIFEEFKGTGNMELKLDRQLANRRIFPAVDVNNSSTRREEILPRPKSSRSCGSLRRVLAALEPQAGIELLLDRLRKTKTNYEFLVQVQQTSSIKLDDGTMPDPRPTSQSTMASRQFDASRAELTGAVVGGRIMATTEGSSSGNHGGRAVPTAIQPRFS